MCQTLSRQLEHAGFGALHRRFPLFALAITFIFASYFEKMYIEEITFHINVCPEFRGEWKNFSF
jgi:hypothetical protein